MTQTVFSGNSVDVALIIDGLVADSLSTYDIDVVFDSSVVSLNSVSFGDPLLGNQLDIFGFGTVSTATPGIGSVNLFELSFDLPFDLDTFQADSFTLATLNFTAVGAGVSAVTPSVNVLGDSFGAPLSATIFDGSIEVPIPEPSASLLFLAGALVVGRALRRIPA